jgi:hypothetical protein
MANYILSHCNFIHIPKCGGSALNSAFRSLGLVTDPAKQMLKEPHYGHLFPWQMPESENPCFAFVRHPASWWLSYYHFNMNTEHSRFSAAELSTTSFDEWVRDYGPFWLGFYSKIVQRYLGRDPKFPVSSKIELIGRTEHLFSDLRRIFNVVGQPYNPNALRDLISGKLKLDDKQANRQDYDHTDMSQASREIIFECEQPVYRMFSYKM